MNKDDPLVLEKITGNRREKGGSLYISINLE